MFPLITKAYAEAVAKVTVYLGNSTASKELEMIDMDQKIVKFLNFPPMTKKETQTAQLPKGCLKLSIKERPARVVSSHEILMWVNSSFNVPAPEAAKEEEQAEKIELWFKSVRDKSVLKISFEYNANYRLTIHHDDMEVVGALGSRRRGRAGHVRLHGHQAPGL